MTLLSTRIPFKPDDQLAPADVLATLRQRRGGTLLNLDRMLLTSNPFALGWNTFLGSVRTGLSLDPCLRELAICAVAVLNRADYEMQQHAPEFLACGGTQAQLDALPGALVGQTAPGLFSDLERATMAFTREMTLQVQVSDGCFEALKALLPDPRQQVELVGVVAAYNMVSRFLEALQVPQEAA